MPRGLPEFSLANVLINEGKIPVQWESQRFLTPDTKVLPNYPKPFNPETWIPFQLAEGTEISITIYDVSGRLVRSLDLGNKEAGYYLDKGRAAHWDGRDNDGERVASEARPMFQGIASGEEGEGEEKPIDTIKREAYEEAGIDKNAKFIRLSSLCAIPAVNIHGLKWGHIIIVSEIQ